MQRFCVATDSGCDLSAQFCTEHSINAYKMKYLIDEQAYSDDMEPEKCAAFYEKMRAGVVPHTSQITPYEFVNFWSELWEKFKVPIVHISLGSGISGTYANAVIAANIFHDTRPEAQVFVVDSTLASIGYGMLCIWAAEMRDRGETPEACVEQLNSKKPYINTYYTTNDLKYLYRSGRVSRTGVAVATAFSINPILNLDKEGHLIVREKVRGRHRAFERIYDIVQERVVAPADQTVYICHSDCPPEDVGSFSQTLVNKVGFQDTFVSYIGPTIGAHSGPGLIAAFFTGQPRFM